MGTDMDILDRTRAYLNCDTDLDGLGVTTLVAAMHDEIARLRADLDEQCRINGMGSEREAALMARLTESQAREKVRLDALAAVVARMRETPAVQGDEFKDLGMQALHAMNLPTDDTALREMIEAARKEGIEAAAKIADSMSDSDWSAAQIAEAIRARGSK